MEGPAPVLLSYHGTLASRPRFHETPGLALDVGRLGSPPGLSSSLDKYLASLCSQDFPLPRKVLEHLWLGSARWAEEGSVASDPERS